MKIAEATRNYEAWLAKRTTLVAADLQLKHQRMAESPFPFLRATFYRWAQLWPEVCPDLAKAPAVLAVGDLHLENFGTWRDAEGRLIWGVNDFDEAYPMAYTNDLVRLATSAHLAIAGNHLAIPSADACQTILEGYQRGLAEGGNPFVLEEHHGWLREAAYGELRDPVQFWKKMESLATVRGPIPKSATKALEALLPEKDLVAYRVTHRVAGLGSLGRQRYVALAAWRGGLVAREAKEPWWLRPVSGPTATTAPTRSSMSRPFRARFASLTRTSICAGAGSCGGSRPIARGLSFPRSPGGATRGGCYGPWASRPPMCIWAASKLGVRSPAT